MRAPASSAANSRVRLMANWMTEAASGARIMIAMAARAFRCPPKKISMNEIIEIAPAIVATIELVSVSRFFTCAISWPITARSSCSLRSRVMPVVTATTPFSGLRPVAKALGVGFSMM